MQTEGHCQCKGQVWTVGTGGWQGPRAGRSGMSEGEGAGGEGEEGTGAAHAPVGVQRAGGG